MSRADLKAKPSWWHAAQQYLQLTVGGLLLAVNVGLFLAPGEIAPGGVSGISIIINKFTGWPIGLMILVLNIPLLGIGFRNLGRFRFLIRTSYVVLLYSLGADVLMRWLPSAGITANPVLNALYGGVLGGVATGLVHRGRGTIGGTGILGRVLQLRSGVPISQIYIFTDGVVVFVAGLVFGWEKALFALLTVFIWGLAADHVLEGPSVVRIAIIVTDRPREVTREVIRRLHLGITAWKGQGMYTEETHTILFCTVNRPDVNTLTSLVLEVDPQAFVAIGHGHQAFGGVFRPSPAAPPQEESTDDSDNGEGATP